MLTLAEASKLIQNPLQKGVVQVFAETSPVLQYLPFMDVAGNSYSYNVEQTLPGIAFRNYNESYTESTGVVNPQTEKLYILGNISSVDRAIVKTQGKLNDIRAIEDSMSAKAMALEFTRAFFKGNNTSNIKEFDGLEKRLTGSQAMTTNTLTLDDIDKLIDAVSGAPTVLFMNKNTRREVNKLMRKAGQATEPINGVFGQQVPSYAGIPIGVIEDDKDGNEILDDYEIYAVRMGAQEFTSGLQAGTMAVEDLGLNRTQYETLIEWICGLAIFHPKAAAKLSKNAA